MKNFSSIIILNWNTTEDTIECLKSLEKQTEKNFEVILVDNGSKKEEVMKLKKFLNQEKKLKWKLILNEKNLGFCGGNNIGIKVAKGIYIVFLNNDTIVDKNWLRELIKPFSEDPKIGITASKVFFYDGKKNDLIQYAGGALTFYGKRTNEKTGTKDRPEYNIPKETFFAMGVSFAIRRKIFDELEEMFPTIYFIYAEELDMSWRVKTLDYKIWYTPKSILYHKSSISIKKGMGAIKQDKLDIRNKYLTFWRNLSLFHFLVALPLMILYDLGRSFKNFFTRERPWLILSFLLALGDFAKTATKVKIPKKGSLFQLSW